MMLPKCGSHDMKRQKSLYNVLGEVERLYIVIHILNHFITFNRMGRFKNYIM